MKILHTADWHIGKKLHKHDLSEDFELFVDWLVELVKKEQIEAILVSGDIFDLANPSSESRRAYFQALLKLNALKCKLILTGGNHDSPAVLNAPRELLQAMDIHVIGSLPERLEDCLIPLKNAEGKTQVVIAALPYLRDPDLRNATEEVSYESRVEAIRVGIAKVFENTAECCKEHFPNVPAIAMGHLFAAGVSTSESERDIQVGNEASFEADKFGDYFKYIGLGHIHRPQKVNALVPTFYSGSPLPLSFSESEDKKRLLILDTENFETESVKIPVFRQLKRISGTLEELKEKLGVIQPTGKLDTLLELELKEDQYDPGKIFDLDRLVQEFETEGAEIVKHRASFKNQIHGASELYDSSKQLEDLKPREVFEKRLDREDFDEETRKLVSEAFDEILEELEGKGE
ncbi:exonuclease SbcCD subunit D C-terminal domain-containing protein [Halocola ammonii]